MLLPFIAISMFYTTSIVISNISVFLYTKYTVSKVCKVGRCIAEALCITLRYTSSIFTWPVARCRWSPFIFVYDGAVLFLLLLLLLQSSKMNLPSDAHVSGTPSTWLLHKTNVMHAADSRLHQFHTPARPN